MEVKVVTKIKINLTDKEYNLLQDAADLLYYIDAEIKNKKLEKECYDLWEARKAILDFIYDDNVDIDL